ncbi:hypothetical protein FRX31_023715 [Thalictrum thalictroides]|uniref:Uncharacterized protein n=1 Tax=Thalictrum thalictroides TaxID=46969 RepID=A0A7J6VNL1_THATH|nr:hypothetical protein FRX31_023715 [Thalictrum thalictroides]
MISNITTFHLFITVPFSFVGTSQSQKTHKDHHQQQPHQSSDLSPQLLSIFKTLVISMLQGLFLLSSAFPL